MRTVAFVLAKGDSTRIRNKNTVVLGGDYLFKRKLKQLLACPEIDAVYLDPESDAIIEMASDLPVKALKRNPKPKLASNKTDGQELFANECARVEADIYIPCLCTSPFLTDGTMTLAGRSTEAKTVHLGEWPAGLRRRPHPQFRRFARHRHRIHGALHGQARQG